MKSNSFWKNQSVFAHAIDAHVGLAYGAAVLALAALAVLARDRDKGRLVIIAACAIGLTIPLMLAGGPAIPSRVLIPIAVLVSAVALIAGGLLVGLRTFVIVGYAVFGVSILILLWRTVGTLLDQSLVLPCRRCRAAGPRPGRAQTGGLVEACQ